MVIAIHGNLGGTDRATQDVERAIASYYAAPERPEICRRILRKWRVAAPGIMDTLIARGCFRGVDSLVDVGCGDGACVAKLYDCGLTPRFALLVDSSPEMLAAAGRRLRERVVEFKQADCETLALPGSFCDAVLMMFVVYHLKCPAIAIRTALGWLRSGGRLVVATLARNARPELKLLELDAQSRMGVSSIPRLCPQGLKEDLLEAELGGQLAALRVDDWVHHSEVRDSEDFLLYYQNSLAYHELRLFQGEAVAQTVAACMTALVAERIRAKGCFRFTTHSASLILSKGEDQ